MHASSPEEVLNLLGQRIVEVFRDRKFALRRAEEPPFGQHFQTNHRWRLSLIEMAADRPTHIEFQLIHGLRLNKNRITESAGFVDTSGDP